jgi:hypothetical protein
MGRSRPAVPLGMHRAGRPCSSLFLREPTKSSKWTHAPRDGRRGARRSSDGLRGGAARRLGSLTPTGDWRTREGRKPASSAGQCGTGARSCRHHKRGHGGRDAPEAGCLACALAPFEPMELEKSLMRWNRIASCVAAFKPASFSNALTASREARLNATSQTASQLLPPSSWMYVMSSHGWR